MGHDRLFKELLTTFFIEFLELFYPQVLEYLDRASLLFLDKEVFTDITSGERRVVDLLVKARFLGQDVFFLLHVEMQASAREEFPKRMFHYFARLHEKHDLPVYPIAVLSYDAPQRPEPSSYAVSFPDAQVLQFNYRVLQLNRLDWRAFAKKRNPVAAALMARMHIDEQDRPRVKLECLRLLATLRLDPARMHLIRGFVDSYLRLTAQEKLTMKQELQSVEAEEKGEVVAVLNEWVEEGMIQGRAEGQAEGERKIITRQLRSRFGELPAEVLSALVAIPPARLEEMAEALLGFRSIDDARQWIVTHR